MDRFPVCCDQRSGKKKARLFLHMAAVPRTDLVDHILAVTFEQLQHLLTEELGAVGHAVKDCQRQ